MGRGISLVIALAVLLSSIPQSAAVTIDWVPVGNPGNGYDGFTGYGAVAYNYSIDKYDVTVGQYTDFLNAVAATDTYGLYNSSMATDLNVAGISRSGSSGSYSYSVIGSSANLPITYVSWGDAARFANWLANGQHSGAEDLTTTETGSYYLNGAISTAALNGVSREPNATIVIPSEDEWYKAAFYNPAGSFYYHYPFSSNSVPTSAPPGSTPNTGNFFDPTTGYAVTQSTVYSSSQTYLTAVGAYTTSVSPYGGFDLGGDVFQWNESIVLGSGRGLRGGSWYYQNDLAWVLRFDVPPTTEDPSVGFRVVMIPEPSTAILAVFGFAGLVASAWRYRKSQRAVS